MSSNTSTFNPYGATIQTKDGPISLVAGQNIAITPAFNSINIAAQIPSGVTSLNGLLNGVNLQAGPGITLDIDPVTNAITIFAGDGYVTETGSSAYVTEDGSSYYVVE